MAGLADQVKKEYDDKLAGIAKLKDDLTKAQEEIKPLEAYLKTAGLLESSGNGQTAAGSKGRPSKDEVIAELKALGVQVDENAKYGELTEALKKARATS